VTSKVKRGNPSLSLTCVLVVCGGYVPVGVTCVCRYTSLDSCSGSEYYVTPYTWPAGMTTVFTPTDITVPIPPAEQPPSGSLFLSYHITDVDGDSWPDIVLLHTNITTQEEEEEETERGR